METTFEATLEGFNNRAEFLTKLWVWIIVLSLFSLIVFSQIHNTDCDIKKDITLPLLSIDVPINYSVTILLLIISGLVFKWLESFFRLSSFRINTFEVVLESNPQIVMDKHSFNARAFFDGLVYPGSTSVWGFIMKAVKSEKVEFKRWSKYFYIFLKFISFIAHFLVPLIVIVFGLINISFSTNDVFLFILSLFACLLSIITIALLIWASFVEISYTRNIVIAKRSN
jgi:hypothetical protein